MDPVTVITLNGITRIVLLIQEAGRNTEIWLADMALGSDELATVPVDTALRPTHAAIQPAWQPTLQEAGIIGAPVLYLDLDDGQRVPLCEILAP